MHTLLHILRSLHPTMEELREETPSPNDSPRMSRTSSPGMRLDHLETFRGQAARVRDGERLPRFIEDEFEGFLRCGWLAGAVPGVDVMAAAWIDW